MNMRRNSPSSFSSMSQSELISQIQSPRDLKLLLQQSYKTISKIRQPLRQCRSKKQNAQQLGQKQISFMYKSLKQGCGKLKLVIELYNRVMQKQQNKDKQRLQDISNLKIRNINLIDQKKFIESEHHKKLLELQSQFNRKQQQNQSVISKLVTSIIDAGKIWKQFEDKTQKLVEMIEDKSNVQQQARVFYQTVISMLHSVSTRPSMNDSNIDHTCQMSSIMRQQEEDDLLEQHSNYDEDQIGQYGDIKMRKIQQSLQLLVSRGLFNKQNQQFLLKFYDIKQRFSWNQLTKTEFYTNFLQFLRQGTSQQRSMQQWDDKTIIEYNQEQQSILSSHRKKRHLGNFQQKIQDSINKQQRQDNSSFY